MVDDLDSSELNKTASASTAASLLSNEQRANNLTSLEANANALKARMASIKSQNAERRQQQMTTSQINTLGGGGGGGDTSDDVMTTSMTSIGGSGGVVNASSGELSRLQGELVASKERERAYLEHIQQIEEENEKFQLIAVQFEEIFHQLVNDKDANEEKYRQEINELTKERDHLQEDVVGIERSFDDLHRRFDNLKNKVVEFRKVSFNKMIRFQRFFNLMIFVCIF